MRIERVKATMHSNSNTIEADIGEPDGWRRIARVYRYQEWLERSAVNTAIDLAGDLNGCRVLDAGAGTGALAEALHVRGERPSSVVLVDSSRSMLGVAKRRVGPTDELVHADLGSIPLDDASVDIAFINYVLHIVDSAHVPIILDELHRIVRPGGALVSVTPMPAGRRARTVMQAVSRIAARTPAWRLGGLRPMDPTTVLEQAGFDISQTRHVGRGYPSLCIRALRPIAAINESPTLPGSPTAHGT